MPNSKKVPRKKLPPRFFAKLSPLRALIVGVVFGLVGASSVLFSLAAPRQSNVVALSLLPSSQKASIRAPFTVSIWEDSLTQSVNTVQANLNYAADKFDFVSIDATSSPFEIEAQATGGDGHVSIARAHIGSLSGRNLVAIVTLRPKITGKTVISFTTESAIYNSVDASNILQSTAVGHYTLTQ